MAVATGPAEGPDDKGAAGGDHGTAPPRGRVTDGSRRAGCGTSAPDSMGAYPVLVTDVDDLPYVGAMTTLLG